MMGRGFSARINLIINAPLEEVWGALIDPAVIKRYMFGTIVESEWKKGSAITWSGEWQGKHFIDTGKILAVEEPCYLQFSHFSGSAGHPESNENYHLVSIKHEEESGKTVLSLTQDNNKTESERQHSEANWELMFGKMKELLEKG